MLIKIGNSRQSPNIRHNRSCSFNAGRDEPSVRCLSIDGIPELQRVGRNVAEMKVREEHFDGFPPS
jgi:hypothetical protein